MSTSPEIILADEPTGSLDSKTGLEVINLFERLNSQEKTIIIITHNMSLTARTKKTTKIFDGKISL
ncbi:MAG: hypothetical protein LBL17_02925 [Coxiellaceae bacterium]|nr:hypothetical protein [Coxiellaceae bacterium]